MAYVHLRKTPYHELMAFLEAASLSVLSVMESELGDKKVDTLLRRLAEYNE